MYSPRSVSTGRMPWLSRKSLSAISSVIIDLPLVTVRAPAVRQMSSMMLARLLGGLGPVHLAAGCDDLRLVGLEVEVEIVERVVLDVARAVAQPRRIPAAPSTAFRRLSMKPPRTLPSAFCSWGSASAAAGVLLEGGRGDFHALSLARRSAACRSCRPAPRRHAGPRPSIPAASACRPCSSGSRDRRPAACWRRRRSMLSVFFSTMALEMSGYLTQNVPPKPQQTSASCISTSLSPSTEASSRARLRLDAELAQPRAGIVIGDGVLEPAPRRRSRRARRPGS